MRKTEVAITAGLMLVAGIAGCGDDSDASAAAESSGSTTSATPSEAEASPSDTGVVPLPDGYLEGGRYRFVVRADCKGVRNDPIACPEGVADPPPIPLEVTVPNGWEHPSGFPVIWTVAVAVLPMLLLPLAITAGDTR